MRKQPALTSRWVLYCRPLHTRHLFYVYFAKHVPQLIERQLQSEDKTSEQKRLLRLARPLVCAALLLPGLDYRSGWSRTSLGGVPRGLCGFLRPWFSAVFSAASPRVLWRVEAGQKVVSLLDCTPRWARRSTGLRLHS